MSSTLIPIKNYFGKYYTELLYSTIQDKYKSTDIDTLFEQRFYIQNNKAQMIIDPSVHGLEMTVYGNEIHISQSLFDHPNVIIGNSLETPQKLNPKSLYNPETFSTIAYLICQNHVSINITGEIDEPIYIKSKSDFETFYNSVVIMTVDENIEVEVVEEFESLSALNSVINYVINSNSTLNLSTFYQNHLSGISYSYRNIITGENSKFDHMMFGKGSSNVLDETKISFGSASSAEMRGIVDSRNLKFHSVLYVEPSSDNYKISVDYRDILHSKVSEITFFPSISNKFTSSNASISVTNLNLKDVPIENAGIEVRKYISDMYDSSFLSRIPGSKRFYNNKSKFIQNL